MIGLAADHSAVPILEYYRIFDIGSSVGCGIGGITGAGYNFLVPTGKGIGVSVVRCLGRICRRSYHIAIVIGLAADYAAVPIHENHRIFDIGSGVGSGVGSIALTGNHFLIPTGEGVGIGVVRCLGRICRDCNFISPVIGLFGNDSTIPVNKGHCVNRFCICFDNENRAHFTDQCNI